MNQRTPKKRIGYEVSSVGIVRKMALLLYRYLVEVIVTIEIDNCQKQPLLLISER